MTVDGCPECGGLWFDAQELAQLARGPAGSLGRLEQQFEARSATAGAGAAAARLCPACRVALHEFEYPWARGIRLDCCQECKGVWVDDGELGAIQRTMAQLRAQRIAPTGATPAAPAPPSTASPETRARIAASLLMQTACPNCGERNSDAAMSCWACSHTLKEKAGGLICAACHGPMLRFGTQGITLDGCTCCGGLWLDKGELGSLLQLPPAALALVERQLRSDTPAPGAPGPAALALDRPAALPCPACHRLMHEHPYAVQSGLHIDQCYECRGVWLDAGELEQIRRFADRGEGRALG
jgi:Zn-finger nucleic acid-binding protein